MTLSAAILSVTVGPALRNVLIRGKIYSEERHPVSRAIRAVYEPFVYIALRKPRTTLLIGLMAVLSAVPIAARLGSEFMPPLDEGDILYMPTTLPNISIEEARQQLQRQDAVLRSFPQVKSVLGKVGRAETPTDPAPLSMVETIVQLEPRDKWPATGPATREALVQEMNEKMRFVGWSNAFTQPIRNRVDMLSTGIRTPIGIKIFGHDLADIDRTGVALERILHDVPGTRSVLFERLVGGLYIDVVPDRAALARYGLQVEDVNEVIEAALGGVPVTTTIEGRNRFTVNVRYAAAFRSSLDAVRDVLVPLGSGGQIPLGSLARVSITSGPPMIRDEAGLLVGYVYVDLDASRDIGSYVTDAKQVVDGAIRTGAVALAPGVYLKWTGQYEHLAEMEARMKILIPIALLLTVLLLYAQFRSFTEVLIVLLSVPFALVGSVWALWLLDYNLSTAVWVGVIALVGLAAQTGVVMIVYIDNAYNKRYAAGRINSLDDIIEAHSEGTVQRVRPKLMTVGTMIVGLVPLLWAEGSGADVMKRIAAPMVGGLVTSAFLTLEIIPVIYTYWRNEQLVWRRTATSAPERRALLGRCAGGLKLGAALVLLYVGISVYAATSPAWLGVAGAAVMVASCALYVRARA